MRALWATLAALGLCGLAAAAPLGAGGGAAVPARETDDSSLRVAEHIIEPAELEAAPAGTRAVLEQLLEQVQALRGEVGSLRADKLQADARAARLSERVDGLEIMCAGERDGARHAAEAPQPREAQQPRANATTGTEPRRRAQGGQAAPAGAEEMPAIEPAELAAVPAGTRAVLEQVLGRMELMRAELAELRADKAGVAARLCAVEVITGSLAQVAAVETPPNGLATASCGVLLCRGGTPAAAAAAVNADALLANALVLLSTAKLQVSLLI